MSEGNPVSPKVIAAGVGAAVLPIIIGTAVTLVDIVRDSNLIDGLSPSWQFVLTLLFAVVGVIAAGYRATDPSRVNTVEQAEARLQVLVEKENSTPSYE